MASRQISGSSSKPRKRCPSMRAARAVVPLAVEAAKGATGAALEGRAGALLCGRLAVVLGG